jgi:hypothetical protein
VPASLAEDLYGTARAKKEPAAVGFEPQCAQTALGQHELAEESNAVGSGLQSDQEMMEAEQAWGSVSARQNSPPPKHPVVEAVKRRALQQLSPNVGLPHRADSAGLKGGNGWPTATKIVLKETPSHHLSGHAKQPEQPIGQLTSLPGRELAPIEVMRLGWSYQVVCTHSGCAAYEHAVINEQNGPLYLLPLAHVQEQNQAAPTSKPMAPLLPGWAFNMHNRAKPLSTSRLR